jgi:methyl-accepting chemotaxis protein
MTKKYYFYDKHAKTKNRLFILFLVMVFVSFGAGLGILKVSNAKKMGSGLETIYEDRVKPLRQLKMLSDLYEINIIGTVNKVYNSHISWDEGCKSIKEAQKRIPNLWNEYKQTYLVEEEIEVFEDLQILFKATDAALIKLNGILLKEDHKALIEFIKEDLYLSIEPVVDKIDELFQMQVQIIKNIYEYEQMRCKLILSIGIGSIAMSVILSIIVVLQWRRVRALLEFL